MTNKFLTRLIDYAVGDYVAPGKSWDGAARRYAISDSILRDGASPDTPIPADYENAREAMHYDAHAVQLHEAMHRWGTSVVGSSTFVPGSFVAPIFYPGTVGPAGARQNGVIVGGRYNASSLIEISPDGVTFSAQRNTGANYNWQCFATGPTGLIFGDLVTSAGAFTYSTNFGQTWATATIGGSTPMFSCLKGASYYLAGDHNGKIWHSATVNGSYTSVTVDVVYAYAIQIVEGGSNTIALMNIGASSGATRIYHSADGGLTWTHASSFGPGNSGYDASICYSSVWGQFIALTANGEFWASADGATWNKYKTVSQLAGGSFKAGANQIFACGPVIGVLIENAVTNGLYARGLAYTADLGTTWNETYFGQPEDSTLTLNCLTAVNNRFYACDKFNVYRSGAIGNLDTLYSGV